MSETKRKADPNTKRVALSIDGKFEIGFVIGVPDDATDDEIEELVPQLICQGEGTRLEPDEITEVQLTNEGTVSIDDGEEVTTSLQRTPAGELIVAENITRKEVEMIVREAMARLRKREGITSVIVLIQESASAESPEDALVFHNCDTETAKGILADAWAKLDQGR
jgi:hypothetical protein